MARAPYFISISQVIQGLINQYGLEGPMAEHRLREQWAEIVGQPIADHTRPDQIRYRKLYLFVDSPAWMQEMLFLKPVLLEKINSALERLQTRTPDAQGSFDLKEIVLRLDPFLPGPAHGSARSRQHRAGNSIPLRPHDPGRDTPP